MSEISKIYEPQSVEPKWYEFWDQNGCFKADPARVSEKRPAYSIVIPPPNVTGVLTLGHVLNNTIQDILARKARMDGKEVLWLPGTDHAGIATQNVVEKTLKKEGVIKHRDDLGREGLVEKIWEWKDKYGGIILKQLRGLGASCDWDRTRFTMDEDYSKCVQRVFVDLYKKGLIYRGKRMVNWCPASLTALSDEEVIMKEQKGLLYYFRVQVFEKDGSAMKAESGSLPVFKTGDDEEEAEPKAKEESPKFGPEMDEQGNVWLTIATTRPETIPGDSGVAVNPKDERYAGLIGKTVRRALPVENQAFMPIVGDELVDFEFGTGVLKVTPAHDKVDFEIGERHELEVIEVINADGMLNELAGKDLAGLDRFKARKVAAEQLTEMGATVNEESYTNNVGFSERADVPIEPRLSEQWFLKYPSVDESRACVVPPGGSGVTPVEGEESPVAKMRFHPERWAKVYDHWMEGIKDWCISRQLWWGHRIPVWYKKGSDETYCGLEAPSNAEEWEQDPDVLDTWFSSWLWPFATMGWLDDPEVDSKNETLKAFYPTTDLVTGPDIIFFWVARMIMAGYEWMDELPFKNVYFTGIIRDKQGRKMSKSLGNSPDPLDLIAKYSADALRFGVMRSAPLGQDVMFDEKNIELGRNFCTKLWNACRFRQLVSMPDGETEGELDPVVLNTDDKWILLRLDTAIREVTQAFEEYRFTDATATLYRFFWSEYCDWYLESTKSVVMSLMRREPSADGEETDVVVEPKTDYEIRCQKSTLAVTDFVLGYTLRLFHPFIPFITEELWHGMGFNSDLPKGQGGDTIMFSHWPKGFDGEFRDRYGLDDCYKQFAEDKYETVRCGRNLRSQFNIQSNRKVNFTLKPREDLIPHDKAVLKLLLNAEEFTVDVDHKPAKGVPMIATPIGELYLPLDGVIDVAEEKVRLEKEQTKVLKEIEKVEKKLGNPTFAQKVPAEVLKEHEARLVSWQQQLTQVRNALEVLGEQ